MHYGRYGGASDDARLVPLFIGYPNLVRGYDVNTFDAADCTPTSTSDGPAFDRLVGSRLLVGNLELRFPLLRPFGASPRRYGPVPVEVAFFADGGVAWNRNEKPSFLGGSRDGIGSAGVTLRVNLLGFAVGRFDFAHPFQRAGKGWVSEGQSLPRRAQSALDDQPDAQHQHEHVRPFEEHAVRLANHAVPDQPDPECYQHDAARQTRPRRARGAEDDERREERKDQHARHGCIDEPWGGQVR
jgi:surface antigen Omp85-like protein